LERGITFEGNLVSHPAGDIILKKQKKLPEVWLVPNQNVDARGSLPNLGMLRLRLMAHNLKYSGMFKCAESSEHKE
jgi:hypothetical protein